MAQFFRMARVHGLGPWNDEEAANRRRNLVFRAAARKINFAAVEDFAAAGDLSTSLEMT